MPTTDLLINGLILADDWAYGTMTTDAYSGGSVRNDAGFTDSLRVSHDDLPGIATKVDSVKGYWRTNGGGGVAKAHDYKIYLASVGTGTSTTVYSVTTDVNNLQGPSSALARPGGGIWTPTDVNETEAIFTADKPAGTGAVQIYFEKLTVEWYPEDDGFEYLLQGLVGAALGLAEMAAVAKALMARTRTLILPGEYDTAWHEIRNSRRTAYSF